MEGESRNVDEIIEAFRESDPLAGLYFVPDEEGKMHIDYVLEEENRTRDADGVVRAIRKSDPLVGFYQHSSEY